MTFHAGPSGAITLRSDGATMLMRADGTVTLAARNAEGQTAMLVLSAVDGVRLGTNEEAAALLNGEAQ